MKDFCSSSLTSPNVGYFKIMRHTLLKCGYYAHLHLQPVLSDLSTYLYFIFLIFITSTSDLIPYLGIFDSSIFVIRIPSPIILRQKHFRCPCPNYKLSKRWRHCKLYYWIVRHCRRQLRHRPPPLYFSLFPSPHRTNHRC